MTAQTAIAIRDLVVTGARSAREVCEDALAAIARTDPALHAFLTVAGEPAMARAAAIDNRPRADLAALPLAGVPIAVKDNICTRGIRTTAGSRMLEAFVPPYDATVVRRLDAAGAIIVGKTNCDEFAMGSSTENSAFGPTCNPWNVTRTPGGSSGGSAVAVAADNVPLALGSDTGGSVRQPAALCGVVGMKPSYGRVSRYGLIAFASSLDQIGPFSRTVADTALLLTVVAGHDDGDSTSATRDVANFSAALTGEVRRLRVGVVREMVEGGVDEEVGRAVLAALEVLRGRGAQIVDVELPHARYAIPVYYLIATAEASSNLARYDGVRYGFCAPHAGDADLRMMYEETREQGFGAEVKRRIMLGTYVLSAGYYDAYYVKAQQVRTLIRHDYDAAFQQVDVIVTPTSPTAAFRLGERVDDPLQMYLADVFTVGVPLAGLPAISIPCGFTSDGLPLGVQIVGRMWDEATILRAGDAYQRDTGWHWQMPPVS
ncbi:MAG: Asp-tRNA(Asn)/Glu-tRNA(Gln) amidotransferase subunit GatA [Bacteroidales bacterium]